MTPDELVSRLEDAFLARPKDSTQAILLGVLDLWRNEVVKQSGGDKSLKDGVRGDWEATYRYALARHKEADGQVYFENSMRLTERELGDFAKNDNLDAGKLIQVARGEKESYRGWYQGEFLRFTYGKKYEPPKEKPEPKPEKVGAFGLFRGAFKKEDD